MINSNKLKITLEERKALLLVSPALILIICVAVIPVINIFYLSLYRYLLVFNIKYFVGFNNYIHLFQDSRFWNSFFNNLYYTFFSVSIELVLGLAIALMLCRQFKGRGLLRTGILIPWIIPTVIAAKTWDIFLNTQDGLINNTFVFLGLMQHKFNWLGDPFWAMNFAILADVWKYTPFMCLLLLGGLSLIPEELYEAAYVDGANKLQRFWNITLPLLMPSILVALLFRTMDTFSAFSIIYVLTNGGPANSTEIMAIYSYKTLFQTLQFGYGSAIAVFIFLCVAFISVFYIYMFSYKTKGVD
ncbi:MAG: sugar ABC transporter permease [Cyanobacteriota bacterium]